MLATILQRETNSFEFLYASPDDETIPKWYLEEQILSYKSGPQFRRESKNKKSRDAILKEYPFPFRVRTDLEKSWTMTVVLENYLNSKKVQFVLELSWNFEKNLLDKHKKSLKMIEKVFWMQCTTKKPKRIAKLLIPERQK